MAGKGPSSYDRQWPLLRQNGLHTEALQGQPHLPHGHQQAPAAAARVGGLAGPVAPLWQGNGMHLQVELT